MLSPVILLGLILSYFTILIIISYWTGRQDNNQVFYQANRNAPWYLVAFGMVGASLSGVTFISVPGWVADTQLTYFQVVIGYLLGYWVVAFVLLPLYYRYQITSIYEYLGQRLGAQSHFTGAAFFFISRVLGAAFRLFLVALVLQQFIFDSWGVPFEVTVVLSILLIWLYTFKGGIQTIIWTDTLQTLLMLVAVVLSIVYLLQAMDLSLVDFFGSEVFKQYDRIWVTDNLLARNYFLKSLLGGAFITICMTGLDQDMMQKNLSCRNLKDAQKNMVSFSFVLVVVTFLFLLLGILLYSYAQQQGIAVPMVNGKPNTDLLFPEIALNEGVGIGVAITFLLGLIAAAYSSADSALASLTTSFCVDFLNLNERPESEQIRVRKKVHIGMSLALIVVVIVFKYVLDRNVIDGLLTVASYTYGPLLGLFAFGMFTPYQVQGRKVLGVALTAVALIFGLGQIPSSALGGYEIGYELLPLNGLLTFIGLVLIRRKED